MTCDLLRMNHINALPHPFLARFCGGGVWPVIDIDVQTGCMRIDVCGMPQVTRFAEVMAITDGDGQTHDPDTFYNEEARDE
jgi:hypothetical protein